MSEDDAKAIQDAVRCAVEGHVLTPSQRASMAKIEPYTEDIVAIAKGRRMVLTFGRLAIWIGSMSGSGLAIYKVGQEAGWWK